jgi:hypothetical protein
MDDTNISDRVKNKRAVAQHRCLKRLNFELFIFFII